MLHVGERDGRRRWTGEVQKVDVQPDGTREITLTQFPVDEAILALLDTVW